MILKLAICTLASISYNEDLKVVFDSIYKTCEWGKDENNQGTSGSGSSFENSKPYFYYLQDFLREKNISSVVDAGCGDWQFSRFIDWQNVSYRGYDASRSVIEKNSKEFTKDNIKFIHEDFLSVDLPKADLLILKDVLQHLSIQNVQKAIKQFKKFKYVIVVNDVDPVTFRSANLDIKDGEYRTLDITSRPFHVKGTKIMTFKVPKSHEVKQITLIEN